MKNLIILNFSSRNNGNCASVAEAVANQFDRTNVQIVSVCRYFRPCSDCDYECLRNGAKCPSMDRGADAVMQAVCDCDIAYYVIPNYCGVPCSNYYAFSERSVGWFNGDREKMARYMSVDKRFIFVSNSMNEAFTNVVKQHSAGKSDVLQLASRKYSKRSIDGDILGSEEAMADLVRFVSPIIL